MQARISNEREGNSPSRYSDPDVKEVECTPQNMATLGLSDHFVRV